MRICVGNAAYDEVTGLRSEFKFGHNVRIYAADGRFFEEYMSLYISDLAKFPKGTFYVLDEHTYRGNMDFEAQYYLNDKCRLVIVDRKLGSLKIRNKVA